MSDTYSVRVYCPRTNYGRSAPTVEGYLTEAVGGCTTYKGAQGRWEEDGKTFVDDIEIVETVITDEDLPSHKQDGAALAKRAAELVKESTNETAVMWEIRPITQKGLE